MPTSTWTDSLIAHLELARTVVHQLPANEQLEVQKLNYILELLSEIRTTFLVQMEVQGFKTEQRMKHE